MHTTRGLKLARRVRSVLLIIIVAGGAATTAATTASAQTSAAQTSAAQTSAAQTAAAHVQTLGHAPLAARVAVHETVTIPSGTATITASVGAVHFSVTRAVVAPRVTCTLTAYAPYWWATSPQGNVIVASAAVQCDATVSGIAIGEGLYSGTTGNLLGSTSSSVNNASFLLGQYLYPLAQNGWYITGAVGYVGAPINGNFSQVTSANTYVSAPV